MRRTPFSGFFFSTTGSASHLGERDFTCYKSFFEAIPAELKCGKAAFQFKQSPWFDFFAASPRRKQPFLNDPDDMPTAFCVISCSNPPSITALVGHGGWPSLKFLTDEGDTVVDIFAGSNTTGEAAEALGRNWTSIDSKGIRPNIRVPIHVGLDRRADS